MLKTERYARRWSIAAAISSVCLMMLSVSCAERMPPPAPRLIYVYPPAVLLQQCEQTPFNGQTFGDAVVALQVAQVELDVCASRIEGVIKWKRDNGRK
ncbi:Rz1-like lysis system protein LysC [Serratia sp. JSRIV006]|uniref:Rz1-like lysis system protein LysC n=1 Tax=Serratia sp. JSRIV006 TaxID=2831896 RepID=UPI001CBF0900